MGFMSIQSLFKRRAASGVGQPQPSNIFPYFGVAQTRTQAQKDGAFILSLPSRGPTASRANPSFTLNAPTADLTMYYAYPVSYGEATFLDIASNFQGGWDGAHGDFGATLGPIIVTVLISGVPVSFYLYQTDYANLGSVQWSAT